MLSVILQAKKHFIILLKLKNYGKRVIKWLQIVAFDSKYMWKSPFNLIVCRDIFLSSLSVRDWLQTHLQHKNEPLDSEQPAHSEILMILKKMVDPMFDCT